MHGQQQRACPLCELKRERDEARGLVNALREERDEARRLAALIQAALRQTNAYGTDSSDLANSLFPWETE